MRRFVRLCCVFLLLFAQQGALTHSVWHLRHDLPAQQRERFAQEPAQSQDDTVPALCRFDATFNQMLGGASCAAFSCAFAERCAEAPLPVAGTIATADPVSPRSRGPPAFL